MAVELLVRPLQSREPRAASLTLMGNFVLALDGDVVHLRPGGQRLLSLLALRGCQHRGRIAGTLWPDATQTRALANLRNSIWRVNGVSEQLVTQSRHTLDLSQEVRVDFRQFVHAAQTAMRGPIAGGQTDALMLTDDVELLPDWDEDWLLADRERLRQLRLHVLELLAGQLISTADYGLALEAALAAIRSDPLRETAHRSAILVHLAEGNLIEARRAYEVCRELLLREVGAEPTDATARLLPAWVGTAKMSS